MMKISVTIMGDVSEDFFGNFAAWVADNSAAVVLKQIKDRSVSSSAELGALRAAVSGWFTSADASVIWGVPKYTAHRRLTRLVQAGYLSKRQATGCGNIHEFMVL